MPMLAASARRWSRSLHARASSPARCCSPRPRASAARAAEHTLMPSPQTVHIGYFLAT